MDSRHGQAAMRATEIDATRRVTVATSIPVNACNVAP
jgi:hypothetical protein